MNRAKCIYEPRGDHGLEGFDLNEDYPYEEMADSQGVYFRIYPLPDYYETCGPRVFTRYFNPKGIT